MPRVAFEVSLGPPEWEQPRNGKAPGTEEETPLLRKLEESAEWLASADETDPAQMVTSWCSDFAPRAGLRSPHSLAWLALQVLGFVFQLDSLQLSLFSEIAEHLEEFQRALRDNCREPQTGGAAVGCVGAHWNLSLADMLRFPPSLPAAAQDSSDFDLVVPFEKPFGPFETNSHPPTFLLMVEPMPPHENVRWRAVIQATSSKKTSSRSISPHDIEEVRGSGKTGKVVTSHFYFGHGTWTGRLRLDTKVPEETEVRVSIVDSRVEHLAEIHAQRQCSFEKSWEAFSMRGGGEHLVVLQRSSHAVLFFLFFSSILMAVVLYRLCSRQHSGNLLKRAIMLKFLAQDFPQQVCIVAYLYGWYARNGLRCQMCLFNPLHCESQHPLHGANFMVCVFTALSAFSNQFLIQAKVFEDMLDDVFVIIFRIALLCFSVLPFTTAVYLSPLWFHYDHMLAVLLMAVTPFVVGWGTICCGWCVVVFKDELDL